MDAERKLFTLRPFAPPSISAAWKGVQLTAPWSLLAAQACSQQWLGGDDLLCYAAWMWASMQPAPKTSCKLWGSTHCHLTSSDDKIVSDYNVLRHITSLMTPRTFWNILKLWKAKFSILVLKSKLFWAEVQSRDSHEILSLFSSPNVASSTMTDFIPCKKPEQKALF